MAGSVIGLLLQPGMWTGLCAPCGLMGLARDNWLTAIEKLSPRFYEVTGIGGWLDIWITLLTAILVPKEGLFGQSCLRLSSAPTPHHSCEDSLPTKIKALQKNCQLQARLQQQQESKIFPNKFESLFQFMQIPRALQIEDLTPYCSLHHSVLYPTANPIQNPNPQCTDATT